jgi:predicted RNA-binding Zn-ribbon protein involved in translation (DUF1610 family)
MKRPNLLSCKKCTWQIPDDKRSLPSACPECGRPVVARCGQLKRKGSADLCRRLVKRGEACKRHRGNGVSGGVEHYAFQHGRRSLYVPARYIEAHGISMGNPLAQREVRHEIALLDAMIEEASGRIGDTESGQAWRALGEVVESLRADLAAIRAAVDFGDSEDATDRCAALLERLQSDLFPVVENGLGEENARAEVVRLSEAKSRIVRVQQQGEDVVPIAVLRTFQAVVARILRDKVADVDLLLEIIAEIRRAGVPGHQAIPTGGELVKRVNGIP